MQRYGDLNGHSGVEAFEIGDEWIKVRFHGNSQIYVYASPRIARDKIERMKQLALAGRGLATYISRNSDVRNGWA